MRRPWMPLYIADYLADTAHLSIAESGVYLHLIMHYWLKDGLPDDDAQLARIVKLTLAEWAAVRPTICALFGEGWSHARIDKEIREADEAYGKRSAAGRKSAEVRANKAGNNVRTLLKQPQPHPPKEDGGGARANGDGLVSREAIDIANELAKIAGHDVSFLPPAWCGAAMRVQSWISSDVRWTRDIILTAARAAMQRKTDGPPSTVNYFEKPIARLLAQQSAPVQTVEVRNGQASQHRQSTGWQQSRDRFREAHAALAASVDADASGADGEEGGEPTIQLIAPA